VAGKLTKGINTVKRGMDVAGGECGMRRSPWGVEAGIQAPSGNTH